jgi:hypothetical protein
MTTLNVTPLSAAIAVIPARLPAALLERLVVFAIGFMLVNRFLST